MRPSPFRRQGTVSMLQDLQEREEQRRRAIQSVLTGEPVTPPGPRERTAPFFGSVNLTRGYRIEPDEHVHARMVGRRVRGWIDSEIDWSTIMDWGESSIKSKILDELFKPKEITNEDYQHLLQEDYLDIDKPNEGYDWFTGKYRP